MFKCFSYLIFFLFLCQNVYGETLTLETFESKDVTIRYEKALKNAAPGVAEAYTRAKASLEKKIVKANEELAKVKFEYKVN